MSVAVFLRRFFLGFKKLQFCMQMTAFYIDFLRRARRFSAPPKRHIGSASYCYVKYKCSFKPPELGARRLATAERDIAS